MSDALKTKQPRVPSLHAPAKKPGRKPKVEIAAVAKRIGRPPDAVKAKMQELQARLILNSSDAIVAQILRAAQDPNDPAYVACLKLLADRVIPLDGFAGKSATPPVLSVEITSFDGNVTRVVSGGVPEELHPVIDMGTVDES